MPDPNSAIDPGGHLHAFRARSFVLLWVGSLLSNIGSWMQNVAQPWLVLQLSDSPFLLGVDSFAGTAPLWVLVLAGGVLADRRDRRQTLLLFQAIQMACPVVLVGLLVLGKISVGAVIGLSLVVGITDALSGPALMALIPSSVQPSQVPNAVALTSVQFNLSRVLGPLLAGVVLTTLGATYCFGFNAISYLPLLAALLVLRLPSERDPAVSAKATLSEGLRHIARHPTLRQPVLTVTISGFLCGPLITFAPVLIRDALHRGRGLFSGVLAAYGVGGLVGAGLVLLLTNNRTRQRVASSAALLLGIVALGLGSVPSLPTVLAGFALAGGAMVTSNAASNTILQSSVHADFRGRVSSVYTLAFRGTLAIGSLVTGAVVSRYGVRTALTINGSSAVLGQLVLVYFSSRLSRSSSGAPSSG